MSNSFEDNLKNLEEIVESLETGSPGLDEAVKAFEKGMKLSAVCHKKLDSVEQKIETLLKNEEGGDKDETREQDM